MKRTFFLCGLTLLMIFAATSCIFDAPGDKFYRTLWKSEQSPLAPLTENGFSIEFLCGQNVCIKTGTEIIASYGSYESDAETAVFHNLIMDIDGHMITFINAKRNKDTLYLHWKTDDSPETFTITLHRLGSYE